MSIKSLLFPSLLMALVIFCDAVKVNSERRRDECSSVLWNHSGRVSDEQMAHVAAIVYDEWIQSLGNRYDALALAKERKDAAWRRETPHAGDVAQEIGDVFDIRTPFVRDTDIIGADDGADAAFFAERVSGGRLSREELMVEHIRARARASLRHQRLVHDQRIQRHRAHGEQLLQAVQLTRRVSNKTSSFITSAIVIIVDHAALIALVALPLYMFADMQRRQGRRRKQHPEKVHAHHGKGGV